MVNIPMHTCEDRQQRQRFTDDGDSGPILVPVHIDAASDSRSCCCRPENLSPLCAAYLAENYLLPRHAAPCLVVFLLSNSDRLCPPCLLPKSVTVSEKLRAGTIVRVISVTALLCPNTNLCLTTSHLWVLLHTSGACFFLHS